LGGCGEYVLIWTDRPLLLRCVLHNALSAVADDVEPFKPHFIVGAPATEGLEDAYRSALAILRKAPNHPEIYEESEVDDFVAKIEDEVRSSPPVGN
jgi:hypothetical protein